MEVRNQLEISRRLNSIYKKVYPTFKNYKKEEKYSLVVEIKENLLKSITSMHLANFVKSKRLSHAQNAQAYFESYRELIRLAYEIGVAQGKFIVDIEEQNEIVSRMMVGYIKSAAKK